MAPGETVGLAEWIIDDTFYIFYISYIYDASSYDIWKSVL